MKKLSLVLLILVYLTGSNNVRASHITGSEITWTCVGQDSFLIKLVVYRDCNGITLSTSPIVFKCATSGASITTLNIGVGTPVDITPVCPTACTRCQSLSCSFPYGIHKYTIQGIVRLAIAGSCCSINVSWGQCCRTAAITTGAGNADFYSDANLNRCQNPCDNSPSFTNTPIAILCIGQDFTYNHGVQDIDINSTGGLSDSITYEWTEPLSDAGTTIAYTGQYAYDRPINFWGFPNDAQTFPRGFHLNSHTGDIQFRPMVPEVTVMVLKVNEFRNSVKIAELKRDLMIIVISCSSNLPPQVIVPNNVRSKNVCSGDTVTFNFSTNDANANDTLTISWNNALPGAIWTQTNGQSNHPTATLTWIPGDSQISSLPYNFTVTAKDDVCPISAQFTQSYQIKVYPTPEASITISDSGCGKYYFKALPITGISPTYKWSSDSFTFLYNTGTLVSHNFLTGYYPIKLVMTTTGCSRSFYDTAFIDTFMSVQLPPDTAVCLNSTISIQAFATNVTNPYTIKWGTGKVTFHDDTTLTKQITITKDTSIWIRATYGAFNCPFDEIKIKVHANNISLTDDTFFCDLNHVITPKLSTNQAAFSSFRWYQDGSPLIVDSDADLNVFDTGLFTCVATDTFGCTYSDMISIHLNPAVIASAPDTTICSGKNVSIMADSISNHIYSYEWWLNKSIQSSTKLLNVSPTDTTQYTLFVTEILNGISCSDTHTVTVFIKPLPLFSFDKFDKSCAGGKQIQLDNFVKVNGQRVYDGSWTCPDEPSQVASNIFFSQTAFVNINPGYKLAYSYTDTGTGCFNSDTVYLLVYPGIAKPQIKVTGDTIFCNGYSVSLESAASAIHYGWTTGDTVKQITVTTSGKYKLAVTAVNGCVSDSSLPVKVVVNPKPPTPVISLSASDSFLECNLINGLYEWYFRSDTLDSPNIISNGGKRINPKTYCQDCYFNIFFTDTNGCISNSSAFYYFHNNSIDHNYTLTELKFYPNPVHNMLFAEYSGKVSAKLIFTDILGNTILENKIIPGKNEINIQNYKPGIYFIFLDGFIAGKVLVE